MKSLFVIDDEEDILFVLQFWFESKGFIVSTFVNSTLLLEALKLSAPDIIILDVNLNNEDGREICKKLKQEQLINCPAILFSANPSMLRQFDSWLADEVVSKPFDLIKLTTLVNSYVLAE